VALIVLAAETFWPESRAAVGGEVRTGGKSSAEPISVH
jgi:hypothetical protein